MSNRRHLFFRGGAVGAQPQAVPSAAEQARTALAMSPTLALVVDESVEVIDVGAVAADGSLLLVVAAAAVVCDRVMDRPARAVVHGARLTPLVVADRILHEVAVHGRVELVDSDDVGAALSAISSAGPDRPASVVVRPDASALLRLGPDRVRLDGADVALDAYLGADIDPLAVDSDEIVTHLVQDHAADVVLLAHLLDPAVVRAARLIAPILVDRFGLAFRLVDGEGTTVRARLNFLAALRGPAELPAAMRELQRRAAQVTTCPFSGEPHDPADRS